MSVSALNGETSSREELVPSLLYPPHTPAHPTHPSSLSAVLCCAKSLQSCPTLFDPMNPPGSSVHGILQARILEWVAMPSSRGSSPPRDETCISYVSCISRRVLYHWCHLGSPHITSYAPKCPCHHSHWLFLNFLLDQIWRWLHTITWI